MLTAARIVGPSARRLRYSANSCRCFLSAEVPVFFNGSPLTSERLPVNRRINSSSGFEVPACSWRLIPAFSLRISRATSQGRFRHSGFARFASGVADEQPAWHQRLNALRELVREHVQCIQARVAISTDLVHSDGCLGQAHLCNPRGILPCRLAPWPRSPSASVTCFLANCSASANSA